MNKPITDTSKYFKHPLISVAMLILKRDFNKGITYIGGDGFAAHLVREGKQ